MLKQSDRRLEKHMFTSHSNEEEEEFDEKKTKPKKNDRSKPNIPANLERDHFLNAFLDHDMNQKESIHKPVPTPRSFMKKPENPVPSPRVRRAPPTSNENFMESKMNESKDLRYDSKVRQKEFNADTPSKPERMRVDRPHNSKAMENNFKNKKSDSQPDDVQSERNQHKQTLREPKPNEKGDTLRDDREIQRKFSKHDEKTVQHTSAVMNKPDKPLQEYKFDKFDGDVRFHTDNTKFDGDVRFHTDNVSSSNLKNSYRSHEERVPDVREKSFLLNGKTTVQTEVKRDRLDPGNNVTKTTSEHFQSSRALDEKLGDRVGGRKNSEVKERTFQSKVVDTKDINSRPNVKSPRVSERFDKISKPHKLEGNSKEDGMLSEMRREMRRGPDEEQTKGTLEGVTSEFQLFDKKHESRQRVDNVKEAVLPDRSANLRDRLSKTGEKVDSKTNDLISSKSDPFSWRAGADHTVRNNLDKNHEFLIGRLDEKNERIINKKNRHDDPGERKKDSNLMEPKTTDKLVEKNDRRGVMQRQNAEVRDDKHSMDTRTNEVVNDLFNAESKKSDRRTQSGNNHTRLADSKHKGEDNIKENRSTSLIKSGPMKATLPLNQAKKDHKSEAPDKKLNTLKSTGTIRKSRSFTNISNIKPVSPRVLSPDSDDERTAKLDSVALREQIYFDWLTRKNSFSKASSVEQRKSKMEEKERTELESKEKRLMAQKAFDAWNEKKTEVIKDKTKDLKKQKHVEKEKIDEKLQRKLDAKKYFESWKQRKDEELKDLHKRKKTIDQERKKKEFTEKVERTTDAKKTFENWKARKDVSVQDKKKEEKKKKEKEKEMEMDKLERKQQANRAYESWKEKRGKAASRPSSASLVQRPWCPSNRNAQNCIPADVKPVIHRTAPPTRMRTMSATARLQGGATSKRSK